MTRSSFPQISRTVAVLLLLAALVLPAGESLARGGSRGGFSGGRSSSFSSSRSSSFGSSSRSWGGGSRSSSPSTFSSQRSSSNGWGSSTSRRPSPAASNADRAMGTKVNQAGNTVSRSAAAQAQTAKSIPAGSQRQWDSEPATRPPYVPMGQTLNDGRYAPVYYNPAYRTYGYWDSLGHWLMWDAMLNGGGRSYYYNQPAGIAYGGYGARGSSGSALILGLFVIGILIALAMYLYYKRAGEMEMAANSRFDGAFPTPDPGETPNHPMQANFSSSVARTPAILAPWVSFPSGSFIILSDSQAMEDSQKRGDGFQGIRYAVEKVAVARDSEGFGAWAMIHLDDGHQPLMLLVKGVEGELDFRVYYASEDFRPARREDVVHRGDTWLFEAPENETHFDPADLRYAAEIVQTVDGNEIAYIRKDQGERHADYLESPARSGMGDLLATVVEYSTDDPTENPELFVLEVGAASRKTGEVTLYLGSPIRESEIDVLKAGSASV